MTTLQTDIDPAAAPAAAAVRPGFAELGWLLRLRWAAAAGQAATILLVHHVLEVRLPLAPLFAIIAVVVASNAGVALWTRLAGRAPEGAEVALSVFDVFALTGLLYFTGGPYNPFSFLFLVYVALGALLLPAAWAWELCLLAVCCYSALFVGHRDLAFVHDPEHDASLQVRGMWAAFVSAAVFTTYFVRRAASALAAKEAELRGARERAERGRQLALLAGLAAGSAHELSTPLATIAVAARELERRLGAAEDGADAADARLIRQEVARCREALARLSAEAGQTLGEPLAPVSLRTLIEQVLADLRQADRVRLALPAELFPAVVVAYPRALRQALHSVLRNALEASAEGRPVALGARRAGNTLFLEVRDRGTGMDPATLARAADPFFTTKPAGTGLGLGLFLARSVLEQLGGRLRLDPRPGGGTEAILELPLAPEPVGSAPPAARPLPQPVG